MTADLLDPADPPEVQRRKLLEIVQVLMARVERGTEGADLAYAQFQRAVLLEDQVRERTRDLERTLALLNDTNARLAEANRAIEAARQNLANAIETIQEGFALFDADDRLVLCNSRFCVPLADIHPRLKPGLTFDAYVGLVSRSPFLELPEGETAEGWAARRRRRHQDRHVIFNARLVWDRWLQVSEHRTADGGTVILQTDVTDIMRLERQERGKMQDALAQAERASAARSRFVAAASHDLLQPLSAAKLYIASASGDGDPATRAALDKAQNALDSVEGILGALLDISKLESGKAAVSVGPVRLDTLLRRLAEEFAAIAAARGLRLTVRPCAALVQSDPAYLRRILQNLIGNALRYTQAGRVLVAARRRGGMVRIEVHDTGPGIPKAEQEAIFREFHRLNARASASEGMGLGLAIVERACALLGHPLGLRSEPGRGSCFSVQVPLAGAAAPDPAPLHPMPDPAPQPDRIAFLVENDADLRRALTVLLEKWGMTVLEAATGEEALALIEEIGILPDAFLVDHRLGEGMTGLDFLSCIAARWGRVPARLMTASRAPDLRALAEGMGAGLLYKPIDARALGAFLTAPDRG